MSWFWSKVLLLSEDLLGYVRLWGTICSLIICTGFWNQRLYLMIIWMFHYFSSLLHYLTLTPHNFTVAYHFSCSTFHRWICIVHNLLHVCSSALLLPYKPLCISHDVDWTVHNIMLSLHAFNFNFNFRPHRIFKFSELSSLHWEQTTTRIQFVIIFKPSTTYCLSQPSKLCKQNLCIWYFVSLSLETFLGRCIVSRPQARASQDIAWDLIRSLLC